MVVLAILGLAVSVIVGGVGTIKYQQFVAKFDARQLFFIISLLPTVALMLTLRALMQKSHAKSPHSFFINDEAVEVGADDSLESIEKVSRFADLVLNKNSSDSMVFGVNAPWGAGKSSFINFCCEYWRNIKVAQPIVLRFEPLRYKESEDLVDRLVSELIEKIQKEAFLPSINSLFSKYLRQVRGKNEFSFFGIKLEFVTSVGSADDTLQSLEGLLSKLNRKIIIIVDDLDRLSWLEVKNILFAIKRSFMLPNVSYVLCYDTDKLATYKNEPFSDAENVREFLEKFVNIEIGLYLDSNVLAKFVSSNIENAINKNLQLDPHLLDQIRLALEALIDIYKSDEYVFYQDFLGDIRKIKRLINTMMLFEIEKTDFKNSDFNKHDLIHLLLIYINYPNVFRKIYNSETDGKSGFFSVVFNSDSTSFVNSKKYENYLSKLEDNPKFLLNKLFNYEILLKGSPAESLDRSSRACFNDKFATNRNLERYLNLIVKLAKQDKLDSYHFYIGKKNELLNGKSLKELFNSDEFSFVNGDFSRNQLWSVIANSAHEIKPKVGVEVVSYLIANLHEYSFIDRANVGANSRVNLTYTLLKLLDISAWGVDLIGRRNNTEENISEIASWIYGEGKYKGSGILSTLSSPEKGPLGLFDTLLFRLYCSADRGSSLFNIQRAVALHHDLNAPTTGLSTDIAKEGMREISQKVFKIFYTQYIQPKKNILRIIDDLGIRDFAASTLDYVTKQINSGNLTNEMLEQIVIECRSHLKSFIIYQLGNSMINSGVGCGYYDEVGNKDDKGIAKKINLYLFNVCFNPKISVENYECFLDFLLLNFADRIWNDDGKRYVPSLNEFTKILDKKRLKSYWLKNRKTIISLNLISKKKFIVNSNYTVNYQDDLLDVYNVLDELVNN